MRSFALLFLLPVVYGLGGQHLIGGYQPSDTNDGENKEMADFALGEINKKENSLRSLSDIVSVETQVVNGINYHFKLRVKNGNTEEMCDVVVYSIPYLNERSVTKYQCTPFQRTLGGEKSASLDKDVQAAVMFATDSYNKEANSAFRLGVAKVENIKKQTTAGRLYTFTITFMPTNCINDESNLGKGLDLCALNDGGDKTTCTYKVSFQAWNTPKYKVESKTCQQKSPDVEVKSDMASKLKNMLTAHSKPRLDELMLQGQMMPGLTADAKNVKSKLNAILTPEQMLPGLTAGTKNKMEQISNHISPLKKREIKSLNDLHPLLYDLGKSVLDAYKQGKKDYLNEDGKVDLDKVLGKDGHDVVNRGIDKLLGGDGHDLLQHGLSQLLGGDGHDLQKHGLDNLLGGDDHDMIKHGLSHLLGGDDHDMQKHGSLIGGDDHDMQKHGGLLGGDDHDMQKHGGLIGGDDHDMQKHGGDNHDPCPFQGQFKEFMIRHGKTYESEDEHNKRFKIFCDNMAIVRKLSETEQGTATYGATKFADLTQDEFRQKYLGKRWADIPNKGAPKMWRAKIPQGKIPTSFDWRDKGAVTPVKNQGQCGSCWAFSTTGNIEGQWKINRGNLVSLSEQELVDCDKLDEGCNGGLPSNAYVSIMDLGGLETEREYKYEGEDDKCVFNKSEVAVKINGAVNISSNEADMAAWLARNGPISIGINANAMQFYFGGISHPWKIFCNPSNLDHGVLIVGYGVEGKEPYWIVKNSWGPDWGEKGYYRVYRGAGVCGLNTMCTSAVVN